MTAPYRQEQRVCPSCEVGMAERSLNVRSERVAIDACDRCGGVFFDFFDGTPGQLARALESEGKRPESRQAGAVGNCPACLVSLSAHTELDEVYRCGSCFGVFATPAGLKRLAQTFVLDVEPRESLWQRLVDVFWRSEEES